MKNINKNDLLLILHSEYGICVQCDKNIKTCLCGDNSKSPGTRLPDKITLDVGWFIEKLSQKEK